MSIWKFPSISKQIPENKQLTLGEGNTNIYTIYLDRHELKQLGIEAKNTQKVILKLETMNPNRSFKDRSLAFQISYYYAHGKSKLLISSSGNAANSAASYVGLTDIKLAIFVSNKINPLKLSHLKDIIDNNPHVTLNFSDKAKSDAIKFSNQGNYINLRGSEDDVAIEGFKTISYELSQQAPEADAVFIPCSSGTSTMGIAKGYKEVVEELPQIHICQTTKIHPMAKEFDFVFTKTNDSPADAIVDRVAKRKSEVTEIIKETNGFGWVLSEEEINKATNFLKKKTNLPDLTSNGCLSFAGLIRSMKKKKRFKNPVCIISGI